MFVNNSLMDHDKSAQIFDRMKIQEETKNIKEKTKILKQQIEKNNAFLQDLKISVQQIRQKQNELMYKKEILEKKRNQLKATQSAIIQQAQFCGNAKESDKTSISVRTIPVVLNKIQNDIMNLSEIAIDQQQISIPVISLFKVSESLNSIYGALVNQGIINETKEEFDKRNAIFLTNQSSLLNQLQSILRSNLIQDPKENLAENHFQ